MATVNGKFVVTLDGVDTVYPFQNLDYSKFWYSQRKLIDVLEDLSDLGLRPLIGIVDADAPTGSDGDVAYEFNVDFAAGGSSEGHMEWHGLASAAAAYIAERLNAAAADLK